ncbi:MAG: DUF2182 domain-containing protein [Balneolaceae bacterium]|nr:DUF2182 domain-containing protein [Balneolaceae bacterium]
MIPARNFRLKTDRYVVIAGLLFITILSWFYIVWLAMEMDPDAPNMHAWGVTDFVMMFVMWSVMMVAMMTPSVSPMVLVFHQVYQKREKIKRPIIPTFLFLSAYLVVWTLFSLAATLLQWGLHSAALLSPMMVSTSPLLGGVILILAGIFQFTALKYACLRRCRSPLAFILQEWNEGTQGAFMLGVKHGIYCVGCCWMLMIILFVTGVMNLLWVAIIAGFVLIEKIIPRGYLIGRITGTVLLICGIWLIVKFYL